MCGKWPCMGIIDAHNKIIFVVYRCTSIVVAFSLGHIQLPFLFLFTVTGKGLNELQIAFVCREILKVQYVVGYMYMYVFVNCYVFTSLYVTLPTDCVFVCV